MSPAQEGKSTPNPAQTELSSPRLDGTVSGSRNLRRLAGLLGPEVVAIGLIVVTWVFLGPSLFRGALPASPTLTPLASSSAPSPLASPASPLPSLVPNTSALPNLLVNGGFEAGDAGWTLALSGGARAAYTIDPAGPSEGALAARIDIVQPTTSRSAIALGQRGLALAGGSRYVGRLALRSSGPRDVLVRAQSADGLTYGARLVALSTDWVEVTVDFTVFESDANATFEIDVGGGTASVWVDAVRLAQASSG